MLTVSIVTYHTPAAELEKCLDCLGSQAIGHVYIIDNSSEQYIKDIAQKYTKTTYIAHQNSGYGSAHNVAMRMALDSGTKYHLVINSDLYFESQTIDRIIEYMDANPRVGALQPRIVGADGTAQHTCRMLPSPFDLIVRRFLPSSWFKASRDRYLLKHLPDDVAHNIPYHQGSFMFLRTDALRDAGLFDERFFMYPEDIDLTRRIHRNWLTLYWPKATVVHLHRAESYRSRRMLWIHITNMVKYFNKWGWIYDPERRRMNRGIK